MREVARRAGVSHQAPYHHFESREDILAAIAQEGFVLLEKGIAEARGGAKNALDACERAGIAYVTFALQHPAHFRLMFRPELVDVKAHQEAVDCGGRAFAHVPAMVQDLVTQGLPAEPSLEALVALTWSSVHGLACLLLDGPLGAILPELAANPERGVREIMGALRSLMAHASASPKRTPRRGR
jgi:AcrR family transcriptional regulator